jgi:glycosyltransferase involved in cell wall biosynthesis
MRMGLSALTGIIKLWKLIRKIQPNVIQTWMYHADFVGGVVARLAGNRNVFWGVVNFNLHSSVASISTRIAAKFCALLSTSVPKKIISCSVRAIDSHVEFGYSLSKFITIPLGYDLADFQRDESSREEIRNQWGIMTDATVIGCVGRWDPQKDHRNLLLAFSKLRMTNPDAICVLIGPGMDAGNFELAQLVVETKNKEGSIYTLGVTQNIPAAMSAFDIFVLSSLGEAFPNVVAEAMACKTPCIVTDVGDAAFIVGDTGWVVPPSNHEILASVIQEALQNLNEPHAWLQRQESCRKRIEDNFSIENMHKSYLQAWTS